MSKWISIPLKVIGGFVAIIVGIIAIGLTVDKLTAYSGPENALEVALDPEQGTKGRFDALRDTYGRRLPTFYDLDVSEIAATYDEATGKLTNAAVSVSQTYGAKKIRGIMTDVCGGKIEDWVIDHDIQSGELVGTRCNVSYLAQGSYAWSIVLGPASQGDGALP